MNTAEITALPEAADSDDARDPSQARSTLLLSRYAAAIFWLARYMERIENLARIMDVTETFVRHGGDESGWLSVVQINADEKNFFARYSEANAESVVHFYLLDRENPNSIASSVGYARENARTLRPLISTEMWSQINIFYNRVRQLTELDIQPSRLSGLCAMLKESCQTHCGITDGTFFRDQGWCFYNLGKYIERADQTTRLVDIKYHTLLPSTSAVGTGIDLSQWQALLRAASGYHAFRRIFHSGLTPASVTGFLLMNHSFPRSLVLCVQQIAWNLTQLRSGFGLRHVAASAERLDDLRGALLGQPIETIIALGLHEFLDWVQQQLIRLQEEIATAFWMEKPEPDPAA